MHVGALHRSGVRITVSKVCRDMGRTIVLVKAGNDMDAMVIKHTIRGFESVHWLGCSNLELRLILFIESSRQTAILLHDHHLACCRDGA